MNYEEKYKDALERAKKLQENSNGMILKLKRWLWNIFPELKESEDEKMRKALISVLKSDFEKDTTIYDISVGDIIAWFEKQGEYDDNIITRDDEILQAISVGLTDMVEIFSWSDFGGLPIEEIQEWLKKQSEEKPTWNEEDEGCYNSIIEHLKYSITNGRPEAYISGRLTDWLKSLKQRIGG